MNDPITRARATCVLAVLLAAFVVAPRAAVAGGGGGGDGLITEDLSGDLTPGDLAATIAGSGVTVSNVTYAGGDIAAGTFAGGTGIIGFEEGVILSSGEIANVVGPNETDDITTGVGTIGDTDLDDISGFPTFDAAILEFDFVPNAGTVFFNFVFSSDEYNEYVHSPFNDVFAFIVNDVNCATVPGTGDPITINTINNGEPHDTDPRENPELYRNNDLDDGGGDINTEMDGLTVVLTCEAAVNAGASNHMKLAIADASDDILDSAVFLEKGSLSTCREDGLDALAETPAAGVASGTVHGTIEPALAGADPALGEAAHGLNCTVVVPAEDAIDGLVP